jgi:two-component system chemotaxis response regulator CheY
MCPGKRVDVPSLTGVAENAAPERRFPEEGVVPMPKKTVLVVDDSVVTARRIKKILQASGFFEVVGHAKNGLEAIRLFAALRPDLVCMDLIMPEMDGLQAIRNIMSLDKDAKIVVISSAGGIGEKLSDALKFGARDVISKPFDPERIIRLLESI